MIPSIIHQTWKNTVIPENWKEAVASCKEINGDLEYMQWTDASMEEFVKKNYSDFYPVYSSYKYPIQRCDAFRYLILYTYGGIYLDMDTVCKKTLKSFLNYDLVLAKSANLDSSFTNSFIMAAPQHPFIKFCIDHLPAYANNKVYFGKHLHIMNSTGPSFLTAMLKKYKLETIPNHYIFGKEEFAGDCTICNNGTCKGGVYFSHIVGQTWNSYDSLFYNFCFCHYKKMMALFVLLCFIIYVIYYDLKYKWFKPKIRLVRLKKT